MDNTTDNKCIFCNISKGQTDTELIFQDEDFVVFGDKRPFSQHHYLVVPKVHLPNAKRLKKDQLNVVSSMKEIAGKTLKDVGADLKDSRFGFHWPPFHTVEHLHMHAISPASKMGLLGRMIFRPDSIMFVTPEYVEQRLKAMP